MVRRTFVKTFNFNAVSLTQIAQFSAVFKFVKQKPLRCAKYRCRFSEVKRNCITLVRTLRETKVFIYRKCIFQLCKLFNFQTSEKKVARSLHRRILFPPQIRSDCSGNQQRKACRALSKNCCNYLNALFQLPSGIVFFTTRYVWRVASKAGTSFQLVTYGQLFWLHFLLCRSKMDMEKAATEHKVCNSSVYLPPQHFHFRFQLTGNEKIILLVKSAWIARPCRSSRQKFGE